MPDARDQTGPVAPSVEYEALARAVARVGDRWTLLIVHTLLAGPRRFGELQEELAGIAPNVLSQRLKHLEREGVVLASAYSERPPRFEYSLTATGRDLAGALRLLAQWGAGGELGVHHASCGSHLQARWWCPACGEPVDHPGDDDVVYV